MKSENEDVLEVDENRRKFVKKLAAGFAAVAAVFTMPLAAARTLITPTGVETPELSGGASRSSLRTFCGNYHTRWETGNSSEEITRIDLNSGEKLEIYEVELPQKGGGTVETDFELEVYDQNQSSVLVSTTDKNTGEPLASSSEGATVIIRLTNQTGQIKDSAPRVVGRKV